MFRKLSTLTAITFLAFTVAFATTTLAQQQITQVSKASMTIPGVGVVPATNAIVVRNSINSNSANTAQTDAGGYSGDPCIHKPAIIMADSPYVLTGGTVTIRILPLCNLGKVQIGINKVYADYANNINNYPFNYSNDAWGWMDTSAYTPLKIVDEKLPPALSGVMYYYITVYKIRSNPYPEAIMNVQVSVRVGFAGTQQVGSSIRIDTVQVTTFAPLGGTVILATGQFPIKKPMYYYFGNVNYAYQTDSVATAVSYDGRTVLLSSVMGSMSAQPQYYPVHLALQSSDGSTSATSPEFTIQF